MSSFRNSEEKLKFKPEFQLKSEAGNTKSSLFN